jgi:hypothetical protein
VPRYGTVVLEVPAPLGVAPYEQAGGSTDVLHHEQAIRLRLVTEEGKIVPFGEHRLLK